MVLCPCLMLGHVRVVETLAARAEQAAAARRYQPWMESEQPSSGFYRPVRSLEPGVPDVSATCATQISPAGRSDASGPSFLDSALANGVYSSSPIDVLRSRPRRHLSFCSPASISNLVISNCPLSLLRTGLGLRLVRSSTCTIGARLGAGECLLVMMIYTQTQVMNSPDAGVEG